MGNEISLNLAALEILSYWPAAAILHHKGEHDDTAVPEIRRTLVQD